MAKRKVPSQVGNGSETFSDNLVGVQITDGTSQLTNSNFAIDRVVPEKDSKNFSTTPFSEFLTLDDLKKEDESELSTSPKTKNEKENTIKFKTSKNDGGKSLFGALKNRILVTLTNIIKRYPAALLVDKDSPQSIGLITANNITYDQNLQTTEFEIESGMLYNPFDVTYKTPNSNILVKSDNVVRDFYSSYTKYVIEISGVTYDILQYTEPGVDGIIKLKVSGKPFDNSTYSNSFRIRPNNGVVEEFYKSLDDLEEVLLNRETVPIFTASFKVPRDSFDQKRTEIAIVEYNWPLSKDGWNPQIVGLDYENYVDHLVDIADEIDDYKSNLFIRFMSSPQLFEFDSQDKKAEAVFQLYGQNFDRVKKFIDNIAYMRNVSYDGINNLPDVLLKNLANTLGLETFNLFDEKDLEESFYTRSTNQYSGLTMGMNLVEAEYEFYRRLLVNIAYLFKSKGTRASLEFLLKFLGAPEPMIKINEYVYKVTSLPSTSNLESDIYDAIQGNKTYTISTWDSLSGLYVTGTTSGSTTFNRSEYPVDETTGLPRKAQSKSEDIFFQKGAGWYEINLHHRSPTILDNENSILTGKTKTIKTKNKPYTYGEDYFDIYRQLPGLEVGYGLESDIDNKKSRQSDDESPFILNRKNINVYISSARAVDYDVYRNSRNLLISFGTNTLSPQTGVTFAQYLDKLLSEQIKKNLQQAARD